MLQFAVCRRFRIAIRLEDVVSNKAVLQMRRVKRCSKEISDDGGCNGSSKNSRLGGARFDITQRAGIWRRKFFRSFCIVGSCAGSVLSGLSVDLHFSMILIASFTISVSSCALLHGETLEVVH